MEVNKDMKKFKDYCQEVMQFFREQGVKIDPEPTVKLV